jgi:hypothetical protein
MRARSRRLGSIRGQSMKRGSRHTSATLAKLAAINRAATARRRARNLLAPSEVLEVERNGTITAKLRPFAQQAAQVPHDVAADLGGFDACSAQVRVMLADLGRLDLVLRVLVARFLQGEGDPDLASKISTIVGTRRATLQALGLDRVERDALDLASYVEQHYPTAPIDASATNGADPEPEVATAEIAAQESIDG